MAGATTDLTLFRVPETVPEGFVYREGFVSDTEEQELIAEIKKLELRPFKYYQFTGKRRTVSFGWEYEFGEKKLKAATEIPSFLFPFRARAGALFGIDPAILTQTNVIEYSTGSPIGWHRDIPQFGLVIGVSLGAACRMRFRQYRRVRSKDSGREQIGSIELRPRSIYLMSGPAREVWQHSIPPVKELRYAVMMRTLRARV
jgi:alkylated DNA repair dioxygenase AlkB